MIMGDRKSEARYGYDYTQSKPTDMEIAQMLSELEVKVLEPDRDFLLYTQKISKSFPGVFQAKLFCFDIVANRDLDWFGSRNRLDEINFVPNFLRHKDVSSYLRKEGAAPIENYIFQYPIERIDGFEFDTHLAALEFFGGAYHEYNDSDPWKCRKDAYEFWKKFTEGRLLDFIVFKTTEPWSEWFFTIHDETCLMYDSLKRRITLFIFADSD